MKSYEEILKDLKIREENEELIGERLNMQNLFLQLMKYEIEECELDIEEIIVNIEEKLDLIKQLNDSGMDAKEMIIVKYNPMGAWYFEKYEEITDTEFIEIMKKMQKELNEKGE